MITLNEKCFILFHIESFFKKIYLSSFKKPARLVLHRIFYAKNCPSIHYNQRSFDIFEKKNENRNKIELRKTLRVFSVNNRLLYRSGY